MSIFGFGGSNEQSITIPPPSYPEMAGMYQSWEQSDLTGVVGVTLDNSSLLISIESNLRGQRLVEEKDPKTNKMINRWVTVGEAKMNELGIQSVLMEVRSFLDKNTIMGYMPTEEKLNQIWAQWAHSFLIFLGANKRKFEIVPSYRTMLYWHIALNVYTTMFRGLQGNEKEGVYKQVKRIESSNVPLNDPRLSMKQTAGLFKT